MSEMPTVSAVSFVSGDNTYPKRIQHVTAGGMAWREPFSERRITSGHGGSSYNVDQMLSAMRPTVTFEEEDDEMTDTNADITTSRRLAQVYIIDPHPDVPNASCILFTGEQIVTDATNEELFFEVPLPTLLEKHNKLRVTLKDKDASRKAGKDITLEAARIRDLHMTVVEFARF